MPEAPHYLDDGIVDSIIKILEMEELTIEWMASGIGLLYSDFLATRADDKGIDLSYRLGASFMALSVMIAAGGDRDRAMVMFLNHIRRVPGAEDPSNPLNQLLAKSKGEKR